jgi:hypothetical protein
MNDRDRLERLQGLVGRLERMPASAERDWMLREVRARAVDLETGVEPDALRARPGHEAQAETAARPSGLERPFKRPCVPHGTPMPVRRRAARATPAAARRATLPTAPRLVTPRPRAEHETPVDLLEEGRVLCLDDAPAASAGPTHPWSRGLRG